MVTAELVNNMNIICVGDVVLEHGLFCDLCYVVVVGSRFTSIYTSPSCSLPYLSFS
jgi:hypothetical protein